jgi:hypothetical protein
MSESIVRRKNMLGFKRELNSTKGKGETLHSMKCGSGDSEQHDSRE